MPKVLLIVAVTGWVYWPALWGDFLFDDPFYITDNPLLRDAAGLWKFWFQPGSWIEYYPFHETVLWLQWHFFGESTLGYHLTSVVLHVANALLVWRLLGKFNLPLAWLGGLIFAVHPAQVESVAWISEMKSLLSLTFFLLAMGSWIDYEKLKRPRDYRWALAWFLVAMLCKISMAPFPVIMLLYAWWARGRITGRDLTASAPFFALSMMLGCLTLWAGNQYAKQGHGETGVVSLGGIFSRLDLAGQNLTFYFSRAILPINYQTAYPKWRVDAHSPVEYLPWLLLAAGFYGLWIKRRSWGRHALLGVGFFLLMLAPFVGFISVSYMTFTWVMDHFLYLPIIGLIGLAVAALGDLEARFPARQRYVIGGATIVVALMAIESNAIANLFVDQGTLWTYTLQRDPNSWIAHNNIGVDLMNQQRYAEAIPHFREVLRLHPGRSDDGYNLAMAYEKLGETAGSRDEAITDYEQAIAVVPDFAQIRYNLGSLLLESGNLPTAIEQLQAAVKLAPQMAPAHENLGSALAQSGRVDDAIGQFEAAVKINGSYLIARNNLAVALAQTGRTSDAIDQFKQVLQIDPANIAAQAGLARLQHIATPQAAPAKK